MATRTPGRPELEPRPTGFELQAQPLKFTRALDEFDSPIPESKEALGGKGLGLVELTKLGLPVPPGIIVTTGAWCEFHTAGNTIPDNIWNEIATQLHRLEDKTGKSLDNPENPLIVSVRSGAPISMPGTMHTILNIGLNERTVEALAREIGEQSAWEAYFDLVSAFAEHVYQTDAGRLEVIRQKNIAAFSVTQTNELPLSRIKQMVRQTKELVEDGGHQIPEDPYLQIKEAVSAVFRSWENPIARQYRERFRISDVLGTAAIIQQMAWGNKLEPGAGAGVYFTRDPKALWGSVIDFAPQAQGPKVVGEGLRQAQPSLEQLPGEVRLRLGEIGLTLERHFKRPQEIEFTYDGTKLWLLQTRELPLSNVAWFRFLRESLDQSMSMAEAQRLIPTAQLQSLLAPGLDPQEVEKARTNGRLITTGLAVSLGTVSAPVVDSVEMAHKRDDQVILVANVAMEDLTQLPENVVGIVAENGSIGSHIARVATRVGAKGIPIVFGADTETIVLGSEITVNGNTGDVFKGKIPLLTNGNSALLTETERIVAQNWLDTRCHNPWRFAGDEEGIEALTLFAQEALTHARQEFSSPKAHAALVINKLIPAEIRMDYTIVKPDVFALLGEDTINEILASGAHATVRTCYTPDRRGRAPWVLLTKPEELQQFLTNPNYPLKYGGLRRWMRDPELTELLIGRIPLDKLSSDPAIQRQHCAWTLTCTDAGDILLQVRPFSPQLRGHEQTTDDDLISYTARYNSKDPSRLEMIQVKTGSHLENNPKAEELANFVRKTVFQNWWRPDQQQLPQRMAAAAEVFPKLLFPTPVLEGQARVNPEGDNWCLVYGMKIDIAEEEG